MGFVAVEDAMPPTKDSRYRYCKALQNASGKWFLTNPEPVRYDPNSNARQYEAKDGDTWWALAEMFYGEGCGMKYWKQLMDFQPSPPVDPTLALQPGTIVYYPSFIYMEQVINGEAMRKRN